MTLAMATRILGYGVDVNTLKDGTIEASANWELGTETISGKNRPEVLGRLVDRIYRLRSREVMKRQGWRCWECGEVLPLQIDHRKPRSRGRDDRMDNLRALCATGCHDREHQGGRKNQQPEGL